MTPDLLRYLFLGAVLCTIGIAGIVMNRKSAITVLLCVELILLSATMNFVAFSAHLGEPSGQIFALFVLTVAAAETAVGLAIMVIHFRKRGGIAIRDFSRMHG